MLQLFICHKENANLILDDLRANVANLLATLCTAQAYNTRAHVVSPYIHIHRAQLGLCKGSPTLCKLYSDQIIVHRWLP